MDLCKPCAADEQPPCGYGTLVVLVAMVIGIVAIGLILAHAPRPMAGAATSPTPAIASPPEPAAAGALAPSSPPDTFGPALPTDADRLLMAERVVDAQVLRLDREMQRLRRRGGGR